MSEKLLEAETVKIADLFQRRVIFFKVPDFQRPYSWGDEQVEQFWDDIYSAWIEGRKSYFFGPMIFAKKVKDYGYKYIVIDGQQRLTTLTILFCVIRDLFLKKGVLDYVSQERIKRCISYLDTFKLTLQSEHHPMFENEVLRGIKFPEIKSKKELLKLRQENRYLYVAIFFKKKLLELYKSMGPEGIKNFIKYLLDNVEVVEIRTREVSEAIRIFQVVNTRGLELSPADIIKANLYAETPRNRREEFKILWQNIEKVAIEQKRSLTDLFTYYAYYRLAPNRPRRAVQDVIINIFEVEYKGKGYTTTNLLYDVEEFVKAIRLIESSQDNTAIVAMRYLPNETYWLTISASAKKENYEDFKELTREIRRLFYLYWIAGYTSQKVRQLSLKITDMIKSEKPLDDIKKIIEDKLEDDDVYRLAAMNLNGEVYGQRWLKPLLLTIEYEYSEPAKIVYIDIKDVHIEHILPQEWKKKDYWKNYWTEEEAKRWLNRLGNLTLLYSKMNKEIQNAPFPEKLKYYKGLEERVPTSFILTRILRRYTDWTPKEVANRHKWLMSEIFKILNIPTKYLRPAEKH